MNHDQIMSSAQDNQQMEDIGDQEQQMLIQPPQVLALNRKMSMSAQDQSTTKELLTIPPG